MNQNKLAAQILSMLDDQKRKSAILKIRIFMLLVFAMFIWSVRWESPLAVIPRAMSAMFLGYLLLYLQSIRLYPRLKKYFNMEALEGDAGLPPALLHTNDESSDKKS